MEVLAKELDARVRYLSEKYRGAKEPPSISGRDSRRAVTEWKDVSIRDARDYQHDLNLDIHGFNFYDLDQIDIDFQDAAAVKKHYYPRIAAFAKETTGANEIFMSGHISRTEDKSDFTKAYARFVHCDYGINTARSASINLLKTHKKNPVKYAYAEFAWYNSWQPFDNKAIANPLCVLDYSSIDEADFIDYIYSANPGGKGFKSSMPVFNPRHQYYYVSNMDPSEVLLIKQLDSRENRALVAPHTSFDNPDTPSDAPPRRSIEVRFMCVFDA